MKGIILAGGAGTRLHPITLAISKQLLPVYNKPMIFYPLCTLMLAQIREILVITTPQDLPAMQRLLRDGHQWGLEIEYATQDAPRGIAEAFLIGERFLNDEEVALVLGDNILYMDGFQSTLKETKQLVTTRGGACIFAYHVADPRAYGVVEFNNEGTVLSLEEKPVDPRSNYAAIGLYFYDSTVVERAKKLRPSTRGELEITDLNRSYLADGRLHVRRLGRGAAWLDMGTPESLLDAANFVHALEKRQGLRIADPDEIAKANAWSA
jgi:glucose-1-phosphate thymidylyltransferase